jgi:hypothetical protein
MGNLSQFQFDVFLSYGWSGIEAQEHGDRGWIGKLKTALADELAGNLGRKARIFLDVEQPHSGNLPPHLDGAIASSALFLSVITPGAVKEDSWCRWEIKRFLESAAPVLPDAKQVFVSRLRDVPRSEMPQELREIPTYDFLTDGEYRRPLPAPDPNDLTTGSGPVLRELAGGLASALRELEIKVDKTFFLAASSADSQQGVANLANLITGRAQEVVVATFEKGDEEQSFIHRILRQVRACGWTIHVLDSHIDTRPEGWTLTPQLLQLRLAKEWLGATSKRVIVFADPNLAPPEIYAELLTRPQDLEIVGLRHGESILRKENTLPTESKLLSSQLHRSGYRVAVLNASNSLSDAEVQGACAALQTQVRRDFAPVWGIDADLTFVSRGSQPDRDSWLLAVLDDSDYGEVPSYHTLNDEALPIIKVFVRTARQANFDWTMCASHELLEALADPNMFSAVLVEEAGFSRCYLRQICDPCRAAQYAYNIDGFLVSDFVFPAWFEKFRKPGSTQFDFGRHINSAFELTDGAVVKVIDLSRQGWQTIEATPRAPAARRVKRQRQKR